MGADEVYAAGMLEQALQALGYLEVHPGDLQLRVVARRLDRPQPFDPRPAREFAQQVDVDALTSRIWEGRHSSEDDRFITRTNLEIQQGLAVELLDLLFGPPLEAA